jgi:hypothetical protein
MKDKRPLLAYDVREDYEGHGGIIYARHAVTARRIGADEYADGDFHAITCRRAPWADRYAPGPCPKLAMIDAGWWFECSGCQREIKDDAGHETEVSAKHAVEVGDAVYCSPRCLRNHLDEKNSRKRRELQAIQRLRKELWRKVPGVTLLGKDHAYVQRNDRRWSVAQVIVYFEFPGSRHGSATYRQEKGGAPELRVPAGDLDAWKAWRASRGRPA